MPRASSRPATSRVSEVAGLVAFAGAALTAISLLSFDPFDPSYFTHVTPARLTTTNLAGAVGANLSYGLLDLFGLFAYLTPVLFIALGIRRLRGDSVRPHLAGVAPPVVFWLAVSALLACTTGDVPYQGSAASHVRPIGIPAGGRLGQMLAVPTVHWLGPVGSLIVLLTAFTGALILMTPATVVAAAQAAGRQVVSHAAGISTWVGDWRASRRDRRARAQLATTRVVSVASPDFDLTDLARTPRGIPVDERQLRQTRRLDDQPQASPIAPAVDPRDATRALALEAVAREAAARARRTPTPQFQPLAVPALPNQASYRFLDPLMRSDTQREIAEPEPDLLNDQMPIYSGSLRTTPILTMEPAGSIRTDVFINVEPTPHNVVAPRPVKEPIGGPSGVSTAPPSDVHLLAAQAADAVKRARSVPTISRRLNSVPRPLSEQEFNLPPVSLLEEVKNDGVITEEELVQNAQILVSKLSEFSVEGTVQAIHPGPVVTTYEYRPEPGIKYSKIVGLADDLCLAMAAEGVRIDRISGKSAVGIEVPNSIRETIGLRELLESDAFTKSTSKLTLSVGKDIGGVPYFTDLRKMPHLLVAGATGAGKSVAINCMIVSILYKATPADVRFIMVDPKRIELGIYDGIPHLLVPVVTDARQASNALRWGVTEMENRYKKLASLGVRSLEQYNSYMRGPKAVELAATHPPEDLVPLPYIVILIDELADLMMVAAGDVEDSISRLAAMARAVGIHLVLATQRPSVDVITGVIKANFPSRISFRVSSKVDSRTILDSNGAEMLLGKGDGLFMPPGSARLVRLHGGFISDDEVQRLVTYLKEQAAPSYDQTVLAAPEEPREEMAGAMDEMYDDAVRVVLESGQASVSNLQRRLRLGYGRAARLVDMMELNGIVGPSQGAKGREILIDREAYLSQLTSVG